MRTPLPPLHRIPAVGRRAVQSPARCRPGTGGNRASGTSPSTGALPLPVLSSAQSQNRSGKRPFQPVAPGIRQLGNRQVQRIANAEPVSAGGPQFQNRGRRGVGQFLQTDPAVVGHRHHNARLPFSEQRRIPTAGQLDLTVEPNAVLDGNTLPGPLPARPRSSREPRR